MTKRRARALVVLFMAGPPTRCSWCGCTEVPVVSETYDASDDVVSGLAVCRETDRHRHLYLRKATAADRPSPQLALW